MKILFTGSRGYCGGAMVQALLEEGHEVVGLDISPLPDGYRDQAKHREIQGDITDPQLLFSLLEGCQAVVHAAISRYIPAEPRRPGDPLQDNHIQHYEANVIGTVNLLEAARQRNVRQFVLISSTAVVLGHLVGPDNSVYEFRVDAHTPPNFQGPYSFVKYLQEQLCEFYARTYGLSVTVGVAALLGGGWPFWPHQGRHTPVGTGGVVSLRAHRVCGPLRSGRGLPSGFAASRHRL